MIIWNEIFSTILFKIYEHSFKEILFFRLCTMSPNTSSTPTLIRSLTWKVSFSAMDRAHLSIPPQLGSQLELLLTQPALLEGSKQYMECHQL